MLKSSGTRVQKQPDLGDAYQHIKRDHVCRLCLQLDPSARMLPIEKYLPIMEKLANIEISNSHHLSQKICEPCAKLLKSAELIQTHIIESSKAWEEYVNKRHFTASSLRLLQEKVDKVTPRLYEDFEALEEEYEELVVQKVEVIENFQNCNVCITPFNRLPATEEDETLEENYPHRLCFDCVENLEKTLTVVKNCRRINLKGWKVDQCILCRTSKHDKECGNYQPAPKKLRDFAIVWNEQTSAEKIALSSARICFNCQQRLTDAMKFRFHILKIEEALFPETAYGISKWGNNRDPKRKMKTFVKQVSVMMDLDDDNDSKYDPTIEDYSSSCLEGYDHEFDFEWNKIPVSYDSDTSDIDDLEQLNQPFHQTFLECPECHKRFHEEDFETHVESHTWTGTTCPYCSENFTNQSLFNHIMRRHKNYKGFLCHLCAHPSYNYVDFVTHMQRMHPEGEPLSCPHCPKKFKLQKYLDSHVRVHLNNQPYRCRYCDKKFNGDSDRRWHEMSHTGNYKHFCLYCKKGYAKPRLVRIHEKICKEKMKLASENE